MIRRALSSAVKEVVHASPWVSRRSGIPCWMPYPMADFFHDPRYLLPHFAFPVPKHIPPRRIERSVVSLIASVVLTELLSPEREVVRWCGVMIGTPVPETSVDEDCDFRANEAEIGPGPGNSAAQPVSETCTPKGPAKPQFRFGIVPPDGLHDASSFFGRERVQLSAGVTRPHWQPPVSEPRSTRVGLREGEAPAVDRHPTGRREPCRELQ